MTLVSSPLRAAAARIGAQSSASSSALFRASSARLAGGSDDVKPRWSLPAADYHKHTFQPTIPDKHYHTAHYNYAPITMWLRARRPVMEKMGADLFATLKRYFFFVADPLRNSADKHLPGFGYKVFGFIGLLLGYNVAVSCVTDSTQAYMFLEKLNLYSIGAKLHKQGFFLSESEDNDARLQAYNQDIERLEKEFETALAEATQKRDFGALVHALEDAKPADIPKPISWRLGQMPFGADNPDSKTFAHPDKPYGNYFILDMGSAGEYIERTDNKPNPIRKARHMYTTAYMPPTK